MRHHLLRMIGSVRVMLSLGLTASAAMLAGCDSSPDMNNPETKKQIQARNDAIKAEEDRANAAAQKRGGKNAPVMKSIKGNIQIPESK
jgi:hypothetical protein